MYSLAHLLDKTSVSIISLSHGPFQSNPARIAAPASFHALRYTVDTLVATHLSRFIATAWKPANRQSIEHPLMRFPSAIIAKYKTHLKPTVQHAQSFPVRFHTHCQLCLSRNQTRYICRLQITVMPPQVFLLLLTTFIFHMVPSIRAQTGNITTANNTNFEVECTQFRIFKFRPDYSDCNDAIGFLASSEAVGYFHTAGAFDLFQLPVTKMENTCEVKVELQPHAAPEESSWLDIKIAAMKVSNDCWTGHGFGHTGGSIHIGLHGAIKVSLVRAGSAGGIGNARVAAES